ncbi:DUF4297 domain-containing protein [Cobetia sp. cqz5-12]|uniref:dsDNA nuclease domain-containing protein n=1 Tax=Cobetia sp. cqz5-12 TaxID=2609415 RepID=UPI00190819C8|nr:dsDNA nuclease domain-containing protein [Cobetia sp. cqz5-12]QQK64374.1 DUF4297 domain-containing protein [Cobetia sp. cqz5-12]
MNNPLSEAPKKEKSGSQTFSKYNYQYHWAFCRALREYEQNNEFALFIEEHEDVVLANSLNVEEATFEFSQVKEVSYKYTVDRLVKKGAKSPTSVIEKLANNCCGKPYSYKISKVCFVSTGEYSFSLHTNDYRFEEIEYSSLSKEESQKIKNSINSLEEADAFCDKLVFIIPDLPRKGFDEVVIGRISNIISSQSPHYNYNSRSIYDVLIREMNRKGENYFDYSKWADALKNKAITSIQIGDVFHRHVTRAPDDIIADGVKDILEESFQFTALRRTRIRHCFNRYYEKKISNRDPFVASISEEILSFIAVFPGDKDSIALLGDYVYCNLSEASKEFFDTYDDYLAALICEILYRLQYE